MPRPRAKAKPKAAKTDNVPVVKKSIKVKRKDVSQLALQRAERRLFRRSSDEAADRAIKLKLGMFPAEQLRNNVDEAKHSIFQNVKDEQARVKLAKKHITLAFWQDLIEQHHHAEATGETEVWQFQEILEHKFDRPQDPRYMGSNYNVLILWNDGTRSWQPLMNVATTDPATCAAYMPRTTIFSKKLAGGDSSESHAEQRCSSE